MNELYFLNGGTYGFQNLWMSILESEFGKCKTPQEKKDKAITIAVLIFIGSVLTLVFGVSICGIIELLGH